MKFSEINKVFFLGIGGIGMSAIARFFLNSGKIVYGYDLTSSVLTKTLEDEGAIIHYQDDENNIPENLDLVIYTPAIPSTNKEYHYLNNSNIPMLKRSQALGIICEDFFTIAIAGTHGKTTTSSMVAHLLQNAGKNVTAFIGGIMSNYSTNFITAKNTEIIVVEADEFDRSFLALYPDCATITSVDSDHLDIYGNQNNLISTFRQFASQIKPNGRLFIKPDLSLTINNVKVDKYGLINSRPLGFI
ncbi:MAG: Mur ligase domain-containing protein [Hyphomicrobiales bacterium]